MTCQPAIHVAAIRKTYGQTLALDEVSFEVQPGEIFGWIGPNGAGKTTTMECVEGLRTPDRGAISVLGLNPARHASLLQWSAHAGDVAVLTLICLALTAASAKAFRWE